MRILYFSSRDCWPPNTGARLRDYYLAREMGRRASVTYFGLPNSDDARGATVPPAGTTGIERMILVPKDPRYTPWKLLRGLIGPDPVTVLNCCTPRAEAELARLLDEERFDTVQVEGVHLLKYLPLIRAAKSRPRVIGDWHNIESEILWRYSETAPGLPRRLYARRTAQLAQRAENRLLKRCDAHVVCSDRERQKLIARVPAASVYVIGNGVDTAYFAGQELDRAYARAFGAALSGPRNAVIFVGSMDYHANIDGAAWFAREVWPVVRRARPDLAFFIVGCHPTPEVQELAGIPGVTVTGTVDDVRPYYRTALAAVIPLRSGSGTRLKILEAMAADVPVVSTTLGAEGLEVTPGQDLLIADSAREMGQAVLRLAGDQGECGRLSRAGRGVVEARYDWSALGTALYRIHQEVAARAASVSPQISSRDRQ